MTRQKVVTTTKEYDEDGRLVKETTTECEYDWPNNFIYSQSTWPTYPQYPWWTVTSGTTSGTCYYINGTTN